MGTKTKPSFFVKIISVSPSFLVAPNTWKWETLFGKYYVETNQTWVLIWWKTGW